MRPGFRTFLERLRSLALAGVTGWAFAETAAVGWLGIGWGLVAAAIVIQTLRVRSLAASLWTLAGISVLSSVCFGVPVASSAARAASIAALTSAPPSSNFVLWLVVISLVSAAIAVHDGIILRVATAGAAGLDRLGFIGEGQRFGVLSGAAALFGITLVETWPGGTETRLIAAAIPMVACGAIAMGEGLLGFVWKAMNRGAGGRPSEALQDRPLAAPRVTHEMTDSVAKAAGMIGKDVVVEQFVPDDQQLGKGEESYAPPLDYEKMAAMVAPRRRSDSGAELQAERTARPAPNVIEAARNPVTSAVAGKPAAVRPAAQAREEVGPLDLWDDEEVAEWETGVSAGQLEAMKQFMSDEEINEYTKNQLAYTKAKLERDEHYRIAGLPEAPVKGALEPSAPAEAPPGEIAAKKVLELARKAT